MRACACVHDPTDSAVLVPLKPFVVSAHCQRLMFGYLLTYVAFVAFVCISRIEYTSREQYQWQKLAKKEMTKNRTK